MPKTPATEPRVDSGRGEVALAVAPLPRDGCGGVPERLCGGFAFTKRMGPSTGVYRGVDALDGGPTGTSVRGFALNGKAPLTYTRRAGLGTGGPVFHRISLSFRSDSLDGASLMDGAAIGEERGFGPDRIHLVGLGVELPSALPEARRASSKPRSELDGLGVGRDLGCMRSSPMANGNFGLGVD